MFWASGHSQVPLLTPHDNSFSLKSFQNAQHAHLTGSALSGLTRQNPPFCPGLNSPWGTSAHRGSAVTSTPAPPRPAPPCHITDLQPLSTRDNTWK